MRAARTRWCHEKDLEGNCKVTQGTQSGRTSARWYRFLTTPAGRFLSIVACAVIIVVVAFGFYLLGRSASDTALKASSRTLQFAQNEYDKLAADNNHQSATIADLQVQLKKAKAALNAIMPSENTFNIDPNESRIVADGHLTIGLVGSPTNEGVNININGKLQPAAAGDVIHVALDPSTSCQVRVLSFDMFRAVLTASCAAAKPQ
jgi:cell division protein FtsB